MRHGLVILASMMLLLTLAVLSIQKEFVLRPLGLATTQQKVAAPLMTVKLPSYKPRSAA